jgi:hypothetical protein
MGSFFENITPLTAEQHLQDVAAILGRGILRLRARGALNCNQPGPVDPKETRENSPGLP